MSVQLEKRGHVAILTIQRPEVHNCLDRTSLLQLSEYIDQLRFDSTIRVVMVTGEGEKAFCAGADLKERRTMSEVEVQQYLHLIGQTFTKLESLPQPVIAVINGVAYGGGTELALACDLRLLSEQGMMGLTETSLGIIPGAGGTQRLSKIVGVAKAKEWIFTAKKITPAEALLHGLVNEVVSSVHLFERALSLAEEIASQAPLAIRQAKLAISASQDVDLRTGLKMEANAYQLLLSTEDRLEGLRAFQEKRKPSYQGK